MSENPWQTLATRTIYANPWLRLREDTVIRPDGQQGIYGVVEMNPTVGVVALNGVRERRGHLESGAAAPGAL